VDVKEQDILGAQIETHWYYVSKSAAMLQFLAGRSSHEVLDVGAGSGFFSRRLLRAGVCQRATCVDTAYASEWTETLDGRRLDFVRHVADITQDLILMMDVIEHVDDDVGFVRSYTDRMPRGAALLITVPAFQFLWSGHDVFLEHKRRYTLATLHRTVEHAGLEVVRSRYFFSVLFPLVCAIRLWGRLRLSSQGFVPRSDLRAHPAWMNAALTAIHRLEQQTLFHGNRLAGLTAFCLATKP
jgi:SAM-dependent methyltransferase